MEQSAESGGQEARVEGKYYGQTLIMLPDINKPVRFNNTVFQEE
jgi:hypothetical protein